MAQWLGQYSGMTHQTKVQAATDLLLHAVAVLRTLEPGPARARKVRAVHRLATDLLAARLQWRKAQLVAATDAQAGATPTERAAAIDHFRRNLDRVRLGGLAAILAEFAIPE